MGMDVNTKIAGCEYFVPYSQVSFWSIIFGCILLILETILIIMLFPRFNLCHKDSIHNTQSKQSKHSKQKHNNKRMNLFEKYLVFLAITSFWFDILAFTIAKIGCYLGWYFKVFYFINSIHAASYGGGAVCMSVLFFARLHNAFEGTHYAYNKIWNIIFFIIFGCYVTLGFTGAVMFNFVFPLSLLIFGIAGAMYIILTIIIISLFISILHKLAVKMREREQNSKGNSKLESSQLGLLRLASKLTLLVAIALSNTAIADALVIIRYFKDSLFLMQFMIAYMAFDGLVNSICIFLQLSINQDYFHKWCHKCDISCQSMFMRQTIKKIQKRQSQIMMEIQSGGNGSDISTNMSNEVTSQDTQIVTQKTASSMDELHVSNFAP